MAGADEGRAEHLGDALSALLDGELSDDAAAGARAHLAGCSVCADDLADLRQVRHWLHELPPVEPPAGFSVRILPGPVSATTGLPARSRRGAGLAALAACAAATLVVLGLATPDDPSTSPPVGQYLEAHATATGGGDPVTHLAPAALPVSFRS